ncbi:MAG: hypothetical protein AUH79_07220 [Betaproteobacteria bacterium 13_1_40CM_4_64_4]|nr:MAG: hypothetical protein AUH79_07220 [Betaproteobacteria bacterium 13_1_40CM_4_64_4]
MALDSALCSASSGRRNSMNRKIDLRVGVLSLAFVATGMLAAPAPGYSQTTGMERRENRRQDRQGARDTRQTGREVGREAKHACRDAGGNPVECRQEKRAVKQGARQNARDMKRND